VFTGVCRFLPVFAGFCRFLPVFTGLLPVFTGFLPVITGFYWFYRFETAGKSADFPHRQSTDVGQAFSNLGPIFLLILLISL
jgi:hypothetical protein